jgi:hypothetical protein
MLSLISSIHKHFLPNISANCFVGLSLIPDCRKKIFHKKTISWIRYSMSCWILAHPLLLISVKSENKKIHYYNPRINKEEI